MGPYPVPEMQLAAFEIEPVVVLGLRPSRILLQWVRNSLEHVRDRRKMSGLFSPVDMDVLSQMLELVQASGVVRRGLIRPDLRPL